MPSTVIVGGLSTSVASSWIGGELGERDDIGFVNGLAWTNVGGVMVPIEAAAVRGTGKTTLTGQLGTVFQESCQAAITYIRSRSASFGLKPDFYQELDIHVHVPELWGVDGPSAGITIATAVVSVVTRIPVRRDVAMTGEITPVSYTHLTLPTSDLV